MDVIGLGDLQIPEIAVKQRIVAAAGDAEIVVHPIGKAMAAVKQIDLVDVRQFIHFVNRHIIIGDLGPDGMVQPGNRADVHGEITGQGGGDIGIEVPGRPVLFLVERPVETVRTVIVNPVRRFLQTAGDRPLNETAEGQRGGQLRMQINPLLANPFLAPVMDIARIPAEAEGQLFQLKDAAVKHGGQRVHLAGQ